MTDISAVPAGRRAPSQGAEDAEDASPRPSGTAHLAEAVERLMQMFIKTRQYMIDRARHDVDWSTLLLLAEVVAHGPMRVKELAQSVQSDPSTVSRHVSQLVKDGFLERHADAVDGRASVLVPTDEGRAAVDARKEDRNMHYEQMLSDWDDGDREQLATLLKRFLDDALTYKNVLAGKDRNRDNPASRKETHA
ncbi:MarR family winged helix-turn-helix transcriptional regulator [Streptomyces sp. NPDC050560]|uniref:MarR family winged helix-turn-helix transcriptional regulator n=1 Tax=Streptomyces sp. NPDC050560 TaxID=3365630 RepID=UPI003789EAC9